jgi:hypothetical protein
MTASRAMKDYIAHYRTERNHQGKNNLLLFHRITKIDHDKPVRSRDRLGGLLRYYHLKRQRELAVRLWLHRRGSVHDWRLQ